MKLFKVVVVLAVVIASPAFAKNSINANQTQQAQRIHEGIVKKQLTTHEVAQLNRGQVRVQRVETRARADGHLTAAEHARILRLQAVQSQKIYKLRHNKI